jgi:hypothetical protein
VEVGWCGGGFVVVMVVFIFLNVKSKLTVIMVIIFLTEFTIICLNIVIFRAVVIFYSLKYIVP